MLRFKSKKACRNYIARLAWKFFYFEDSDPKKPFLGNNPYEDIPNIIDICITEIIKDFYNFFKE